ncbi:MAG: FecR domain-containing protein, partial [Acidobacteria bacterium]|nr:FecR domain-containing protein [Acidobacteriota bacterium]
MSLAEGSVAVEQPVTGERIQGERNLPVGQGAWIETDVGGRAEVELDEGSFIRLGPGSLAELSDLTRLSTGQRITLVSLERGTLYATGEPKGLDALLVVAPGLQVTFLAGSRLRVEAGEETSIVAVIEGRVRFSSRAAELDLKEGQTVNVDPQAVDRFQLFRELTPAELDKWSEQRDREAGERGQGTRLAGFAGGLGELDASGKWMEAPELGKVWQPRVAEGWTPFHTGRWRWYDALAYTWVSAEAWGWFPYHYGRWAYLTPGGWVWAPPTDPVSDGFHPGAAYWLRGAGFVGWGPLVPGEQWRGTAPSLYSAANTTFAAYQAGARVLDPERVPPLPRDPRAAGQFLAALPAPPPLPAISAATRRKTRVGT